MGDEAFTTTAHLVMEEDILRIKIFENARIEFEDMVNLYQTGYRLSKEKKVLALVDVTVNFQVSLEARAYAASAEAAETRIATAFVSGNTTSRLIVNLFLVINKPVSPMKMFSSEKSAIRWLKSF